MIHTYFYKTVIEMKKDDAPIHFAFTVAPLPILNTAKAALLANDDFTAEIYENGATSNGTQIYGTDTDRNDICPHGMVIKAGPTIISLGTLIWATRTFVGSVITGVNSKVNYDIKPKYNTIYIWKLSYNGKATGLIDIDFYWDEDHPGCPEIV